MTQNVFCFCFCIFVYLVRSFAQCALHNVVQLMLTLYTWWHVGGWGGGCAVKGCFCVNLEKQ